MGVGRDGSSRSKQSTGSSCCEANRARRARFSRCYMCKFPRGAQILGILKTLGYSSRQGAKTLSLEIFFPLRLRVFAGDTPNFCVLYRRFKFFAVKLGNQFFNPKFLAAISAML
jgi:hypothetical protein